MKDVRIGNDISVIWSLYSDQKPFLLDGLKISVYLKGMYGKTKIEDYTIKDNEIHWTFFGKDQKHTGKYSLTLVVNEGAEGMVTTDVCDLVRLVSCTCQADGSDEDGVQTETIAVNSEVELLSGGFGRIDTALDPMSENAVSNAVITAEFGKVNEATSGLKTQMADDKAELMTNLEQVGVLAYEAAMRSSRNEQNKVDKIEGKGLSTNDYTDKDKSKLEGLDNYDDSEVKQSIKEVRESIANINPAPMVSVTYSELVALRNNGELIAGMQYRITDYVTTTVQENTRSAGYPFDVIVTADSNNALNEVARAGFPTFNIERYKDVYSHSLGEDMSYIGIYEYEGEEYHLYETINKAVQMLVNFTETINFSTQTSYPHEAFPTFTRQKYNDIWGEWEEGAIASKTINFNASPNSVYFHDAEAKLEVWKIWYSLDNDAERFAWADTENGKGVIYRMIDEFDNDCPYDFKNIMFKRRLNFDNGYAEFSEDGKETWVYTFAGQSYHIYNEEWSGMLDGSLESPFGHQSDEGYSTFHSNIIKPYIKFWDDINDDRTKAGIRYLNDNVFLGYWEEIGSMNEEDAPYYYPYCCHSNRLGDNCFSNTFGNGCHSNTFGNYCNSNTFGNGCYFNTFGNGCHSNTFGNYCYYNSFSNSYFSNTFGNGCHSNTFGNYCSANTFGNSCFSNTFGNNCSSNSFSNNCYSNSFRDLDGFASFSFCKFDTGVRSLEIYCDENNGMYDVKYIHVYSGVTGWVEIGSDNRKYETCYACNKNGKVQEFCIMDFANS